MPFFTRLTDIVTCRLTEILDGSDDPELTLREVIQEMEEGLSGARRSAHTVDGNRGRIRHEIENYTDQIEQWMDRARRALGDNDEDQAREALTHKMELEDLVNGLRPELEAAEKTYQHMLRIQKALEARHSEAHRRLGELTRTTAEPRLESEAAIHAIAQSRQEKQDEVEAELKALKKQLP